MLSSFMKMISNIFDLNKVDHHNRFTYSIKEPVRIRIFKTIQLDRHYWGHRVGFDFNKFLREVGEVLQVKKAWIPKQIGQICFEENVLHHFMTCQDDEFIDVLEFSFFTNTFENYTQDGKALVCAINKIFEEEGVGYELTPPRLVESGEEGVLFGRRTGRPSYNLEYPKTIRKEDQILHKKTVKPALEALSDHRFNYANTEMINALDRFRKGEYADAITSCGSAFESVMKTICNIKGKGWEYDPKDACARLVEVCGKNGLFYSFYSTIFAGVGTMRNKLGDAHGKGPKPEFIPSKHHAEHMIAITCANIWFLIESANINQS